MVKTTKIGSKNTVIKRIPKKLDSVILNFQMQMQQEENARRKTNPKKISFGLAGLKLAMEIEKIKK